MNNDNSVLAHHIEIDSVHCTIIKNGQSTKIDPIITRLIVYFIQHPAVVISRTELAEKVWKSSFTSDDAINRSISTLRKALSNNRGEFIKTVPKKGYCFSVPDNTSIEIIDKPEPLQVPISQTAPLVAPQDDPKSASPLQQSTPIAPSAPAQSQPASVNLTDVAPDNTVMAQASYSMKPVRFFMVVVGILLLAGAFYWWFATNVEATNLRQNQPMESHVDSNNGSIQRIALGLGQWQSHSDKLDQDFVGQLQRLMLSDLSREESFLVKYQQNDRRLNNKSYHFDVKLKVFDDDVVANLSLIHSQSNTVKEIFTVTEPMSDASGAFDSIEVMEALSKQMTTAVRVALLHSRWFKSYRGALEEYSYEDLELLIHAREYSYNYNPGVRDSSKKILQTLKQKYPNNPYPYGIEALSYVFTMDMYRDRWSNIHQPMFELTQKTLQLDPSNADALIALFHYNYHYAGARHKVDKVVQDLLHYHPHDQHAWRTKLFLMIKSAQPCEDIRGFIGEMPAGVFKPIRIQVIKRILATCLDGADVNQLLTVHSDSSRSKQAELRAIMNNLYLFEVRHDNLAEVYTLKYKNKTKGRYLAEHYAASLQMGDQLRTQALSYEINKVAAGFELWLANLYAELYQMEPFSDHDVFAINDYRFIERFSDLNLAAALIQDMRRNNDKNKLQHYLEERPVFDVNMINRYESIARMMVLYANGDIEHSRRIAVKLYNLFESYRVNNQKSYYFYNMGRFQLLAAFYCGSVCAAIDTVDAQTRLDSWFAQNHIWWFDDQQFTKIVLSFWPEHPLVRAYLERISQDKLRLKDKLGF